MEYVVDQPRDWWLYSQHQSLECQKVSMNLNAYTE